MSEVEKALTDAYYWLSMYKSGAVPEGLAMEKVKEAIFEQPTLNENQKGLLKSSIDEIERVMLGNKSKDVNNVYLNNAIRFIKIVLEQEE